MFSSPIKNKISSSLFSSMIIRSLLVTLLVMVGISAAFYWTTVEPETDKAFEQAAELALKELALRLESKEESVVSMGVSIARDERVREGLFFADRDLMLSALTEMREDYARVSQFHCVTAQVIDMNRVIMARSWDVEFWGEIAPHPLGEKVVEQGRAEAAFGVGNAGVGIVGFSPVYQMGEMVGLVSLTQGVGSVVRALKTQNIGWVMVIDKQAVAGRTQGHLPRAYQENMEIYPGFLLAHKDWFDLYDAEFVKSHWHLINDNTAPILLDNKIIVVAPVIDNNGVEIGKNILLLDAQPVLAQVAAIKNSLIGINVGILLILLLLTFVLLWDLRQRVIKPLRGMTTMMMGLMERGRFDQRTECSRKDEFGQMQRSFNALLSCWAEALDEANKVISSTANGDFERKMQGVYQGDLARLQQGLNAAIEDLRATHVQLTAASKAKSMFLANMSHEIRTPMNAIIGMAYLALKTDLDDRQYDYINKIHVAGQSLLGIINDILDFSKVEAGKLQLEAVDFSLQDVLTNSVVMVRQKAGEKGIELLLDLKDADLIKRFSHYRGDPLRLSQVITNLLSNAVKFTEQGYVRLAVEIKSVDEGAPERVLLTFRVEDTGIGMSDEQMKNLFQEFNQADNSTTRRFGGTGLGLTISQKLVELMGGGVEVESKVGRGSCFSFSVSFDVAKPFEVKTFSMKGLPSNLRALVVDNQLAARQVMVEMLGHYGVRVEQVDSGVKALEVLKSRSGEFDYCFIDWVMPEMDGDQLLREIAKLSIDRPELIVVSAFDSDQLHQQAVRLGAKRVMMKPLMPKDIEDVLFKKVSQKTSETQQEGSVRLEGMSVLLVEDNLVNQLLARKLLEAKGVKVTLAENGQRALEILEEQGSAVFDLVLMDLQMPVMDGYTAAQEIRAQERYDSLPIVAMTAHAMLEEQQRCQRIGMVGHITKPINPVTLYQTLEEFYNKA